MPYSGGSGAGRGVRDSKDWNDAGRVDDGRHRLRAHARPAATYPVSVAEVRRLRHEQELADGASSGAARRRPITGGTPRRVSGPAATDPTRTTVEDRLADSLERLAASVDRPAASVGRPAASVGRPAASVGESAGADRPARSRRRSLSSAWDDPWASEDARSAEPWAVAGEWWDEPRQAAAAAARSGRGDGVRFDESGLAIDAGRHQDASLDRRDEPGLARAVHRRDRDRDRSADPRAGWRQRYLDPAITSSRAPRSVGVAFDPEASIGTPALDRDTPAGTPALERGAPAARSALETADAQTPPGRRTVTITGRGSERQWSPVAPAPRPKRRPVDRLGYKPDRMAMWAVLLGIMMLLVAAASSHAAVLEVHRALLHAHIHVR